MYAVKIDFLHIVVFNLYSGHRGYFRYYLSVISVFLVCATLLLKFSSLLKLIRCVTVVFTLKVNFGWISTKFIGFLWQPEIQDGHH